MENENHPEDAAGNNHFEPESFVLASILKTPSTDYLNFYAETLMIWNSNMGRFDNL
jgi:hypothetical protein